MANRRGEVRFEEMFPWEIAAAMAEAPLCYLPLGTLEWHGEHAAVGLDALKAHAVCVRAAVGLKEKLEPLCYMQVLFLKSRTIV